MSNFGLRVVVGSFALAWLAACGSAAITDAPVTTDAASLTLSSNPNQDDGVQGNSDFEKRRGRHAKLLRCPTTETATTTAVVTPLGGLLSVAGTSVSIPAGAVTVPTTITVTVPASQYMEIDVTALGVEHFIFAAPVTVTVSYARCDMRRTDRAPLYAYHINSITKKLLERMPSVDDKTARTVTFTTGHLSGYALAN